MGSSTTISAGTAPQPTPAERLPGWIRDFWEWLVAVPDDGDAAFRRYYASGRVRIIFAIAFGALYWHFLYSEWDNPLYSQRALRIFGIADMPLRALWLASSTAILLARAPAWLRRWNRLAIFVEACIAANIVIHTGALTSYFLWIYPVLPLLYRIVFDRATAVYATLLALSLALFGAGLSISGLYPEAAWYAEVNRQLYQDPYVAFMGIVILIDAMVLGPLLGEVAMSLVARRERELEESNRRLAAALEEVAAKQRALVEAGALAAIGEFVRGAAHEIGNPLGAAHSLIDDSLQTLKTDPEAPLPVSEKEDIAESLKFALQAQERVRSIVGILHELSVHTEVRAGRFPVSEALKPLIPDGGADGPTVRFTGPIPAVHIDGNAGQLGDALERVVDNAREFAQKDLTIGVEVREGDRLEIVIEDDGCGFSEPALQSALEPFFTTRKADKTHLGLGLFVARTIIGRMGGLVTLENGEKGARVKVELPLVPAASEASMEQD